ncbi:filamentous hemagglutinin N-terminal domain-containing protein [Belnapia sp. F-4-1]|uniref:two-partner secretion domain-containing protein n=1 Tax=Belnapia sp. F-4-1 TaxID=1545443 RepID=UPI000AECEC68|nr:filamentous hemagglutinin N-terminal domain-containing protein [Belnapia sp. F-4-1]
MAASAWTCPVMLRAWLLGTTALLPAATAALGQAVAPNALPTGWQVVAGQAAIAQSGTAMQVRQGSDRAAVNWQSFNIGANASVNFQQPGATPWTLNRVTGPDPSVIAGRMTANGGVAIVNQSGMVFAQGAQVNVGSLIASAANVTNENFMAGRMVFDGAPRPGARVENHGSITVADRGLAALVGPRVGNTGTIRARLGRVALAGAETYSLDLAGDGLLSIDVTQAVRTAPGGATALVTNSGVVEAQGGAVLITAHAASGLVEDLVRNTGRISADTAAGRAGQVALRAEDGGVRVEGRVSARGGAGEHGGRVELRGSSATTIGATARVSASGGAGGGTVLVGTSGIGRSEAMSARTAVEAGARLRADARQQGQGGTIAVNSASETVARGRYSVRGGAQGGNGGLVELSGQRALTIAAQVDAAAPRGRRGMLLLDPTSIQVVADADAPADPDAPVNSVVATTAPDGTIKVRASDLDKAAASVTLQAGQDITISTAVNLAGNTLNLWVGGAVTQADDAIITAATLVIRGADGSGRAGSAVLRANNQVGTLDAKVGGTLDFSNGANALTIREAVGGTVTLATGGNLTLHGALSGTAVALHAGGAITQTSGAVTAATLTVRGAAGGASRAASVSLEQANAVGTLDARAVSELLFSNGTNALAVAQAAASNVRVTTGGALELQGAVGQVGGRVALHADGAITQTADGIVTAGVLTLRGGDGNGAAGAITLDRGNAVGVLDALSAGDIVVRTTGAALTIDQARRTGSGGAVQVVSDGDMTLKGAVGGLAAAVHVVATNGGVLQAGGAVTAASLVATAGAGAISLDRADNRIAGVTASAGGGGQGVAIRSDRAMNVLAGGITAGKGSTIALTGPALTIANGLGFGGWMRRTGSSSPRMRSVRPPPSMPVPWARCASPRSPVGSISAARARVHCC